MFDDLVDANIESRYYCTVDVLISEELATV